MATMLTVDTGNGVNEKATQQLPNATLQRDKSKFFNIMTAKSGQLDNIDVQEVTPQLLKELAGDMYIEKSRLRRVRSLGEGGFAVVFQCTLQHEHSLEYVAVKQMKEDVLRDKNDVREFFKEANILRKIKHENIVGFKGIGCLDERSVETMKKSMFFVEELLGGGTLEDVILRQSARPRSVEYTASSALTLLINVAEALQYLHTQNVPVVHRDVKPTNILLTEKDVEHTQAKLADFGLHRRVRTSHSHSHVSTTSSHVNQRPSVELFRLAQVTEEAASSARLSEAQTAATANPSYPSSPSTMASAFQSAQNTLDAQQRGTSTPTASGTPVAVAEGVQVADSGDHDGGEQAGDQSQGVEWKDRFEAGVAQREDGTWADSSARLDGEVSGAQREGGGGVGVGGVSASGEANGVQLAGRGVDAKGAGHGLAEGSLAKGQRAGLQGAGSKGGGGSPSATAQNEAVQQQEGGAEQHVKCGSPIEPVGASSVLLDTIESELGTMLSSPSRSARLLRRSQSYDRFDKQVALVRGGSAGQSETSPTLRPALKKPYKAAGGSGMGMKKSVSFHGDVQVAFGIDGTGDDERTPGITVPQVGALAEDRGSAGSESEDTLRAVAAECRQEVEMLNNMHNQAAYADGPWRLTAVGPRQRSGEVILSKKVSDHIMDRLTGQEARKATMETCTTPMTGGVGSFMYMAPEVYRKQDYNEKIDTFSFALVMYELMCQDLTVVKVVQQGLQIGRMPSQSIRRYVSEVSRGHREPIPPFWPESLSSIIQDCWAADPDDRPQISEVVDRLRAIEEHGELEHLRLGRQSLCSCCSIM